jgi:Putative oxidoreductase C terminal domain/Oxidoreductase family, NAD-binding Rossmann fold
MNLNRNFTAIILLAAFTLIGLRLTAAEAPVRLITLDPGHFHASLVQKSMYPGVVDPRVHVYSPGGPELEGHLKRIEGFNSRAENPTAWKETVYTGPDFLEKMLAEKPGNVVVISGNNRLKARYILASIQAGLNVLADKPMAITPADLPLIQEAVTEAARRKLLLRDIMPERYEITTILQRELARRPAVFGELLPGTPEDPAVVQENVHYYFKQVDGKPLIRPPWFFDVKQQGEGIIDVATHLVDLVQWEAFPETPLSPADVTMISAVAG